VEGGQIAFAAIVITLFAVGAIVAVSLHYKAERERREAMRALAAQMGFAFTERDPLLDQRFRGFRDFGRGHSRTGLNLISGETRLGGVRMRLLMGDYRYKITTSNGKSTSTATYNMSFISVVPVLRIAEELAVRSENFLDRLGAFVGFEDIDFESSEFSRRFHVKCSDRRFASDLFDPRMIEFFLESAVPEIEVQRGILLFDHGTRRWDPERFAVVLGWVDGFFARVPRHVRADRLPADERASDPVLNPTVRDGDGGAA
jgi:hypothetical protein